MTAILQEDGLSIHTALNSGERALWIHGYTLNSNIWSDLWNLLPEYSHLSVDLPGHGTSRPFKPNETLDCLALTLAHFADRHDIRHLVGLSFGGMVALQVAMIGSFASLVLASPALAGGPQDKFAQTRNLELARCYQRGAPPKELRQLWMQSPPNIFKGASKRPKLWQRLCDIIDGHSWSELSDTRMQILTGIPQTPSDLRRIRAGTLIMVGDEDMDAFKRTAELIRRNVPNCRRIYIPDTGHLSLLESPEIVSPLIADHWKRHARPSLRD